MQEEEQPSLVYDYSFSGGKLNTYIFETGIGIIYNVKFKSTDYLFPVGSEHNSHTFEFIIEVYYNPTGKNPPLDKITSTTVAKIFVDFFERNNRTIIIYICDSSDSRQNARKRKFTLWFEAYNLNSQFCKLDTSIKDSKGIYYPISIMLRMDNPVGHEILRDFKLVTDGYNK